MKKTLRHIKGAIYSLTLFEKLLWLVSELAVIISFALLPSPNPLTLAASIIGLTALIFTAKGDVMGQILIIIFSLLYAAVSFGERYYGEMISYVFMSGGIAVFSTVAWIKHPYREHQVRVGRLTGRSLSFIAVSTVAVTVSFYFILKLLGTANLTFSTLSIATSFIASSLTVHRSPFYALAYAVNDVVLIVLWVLAAIGEPANAPMIVCFLAFLVNDLYGFTNWIRMKNAQKITERS